jgi:hypothetical protein
MPRQHQQCAIFAAFTASLWMISMSISDVFGLRLTLLPSRLRCGSSASKGDTSASRISRIEALRLSDCTSSFPVLARHQCGRSSCASKSSRSNELHRVCCAMNGTIAKMLLTLWLSSRTKMRNWLSYSLRSYSAYSHLQQLRASARARSTAVRDDSDSRSRLRPSSAI